MQIWNYWDEMSYYKYSPITNHSRLRTETVQEDEIEQWVEDESEDGETE